MRKVLALNLLARKNLILECLFGLIVEVQSPPPPGLARHRLAAYGRTSQQRGEEFKEVDISGNDLFRSHYLRLQLNNAS